MPCIFFEAYSCNLDAQYRCLERDYYGIRHAGNLWKFYITNKSFLSRKVSWKINSKTSNERKAQSDASHPWTVEPLTDMQTFTIPQWMIMNVTSFDADDNNTFF